MDTHGMKFVVDTTGVAKGFRDYRSAVEGIFASLNKFEAHVEKTMKGVAKATANPQALASFKKAISAFGKVDIDTSAARKLSALSAAMSGFKAPSPAQSANTKKFFNVLSSGMPDLTAAYRSIKAIDGLKAAMSGFKAPAAAQSKNLSAFAAAMTQAAPAFARLKSISGISGIANELASISLAMRNLKAPSAAQVTNLGNLGLALRGFNFSNLGGVANLTATLTALGNFRAPSPAQIRNLQSFVTAVGNLRVPANAEAVAAALRRIAGAVGRASDSMRGLRGNIGGLGGALGGLGGQARNASLQMMGLQNAFSGTFQIASALRSLLGSLTIAELGRNFFTATNAALQFKAQMRVLSDEVSFANTQLDYVNKTANSFGTDMIAAEQGFAKISIAADKSGMSVMQTRHIFEGMSTAMTVLGTTTAGQQDVWLALQQVMNKGYLSAEELNQQLNEKLPGAMAYATEYANKMGLSLEKGLKTKALDAAGVLEHISKRMKEDFGPSVAGALMRPAAQMNILKNNFNTLFQAIGEAGGNDAFANLLASINEKMNPEAIDRFARAVGEGLKNAVDSLSEAFNWLYMNWDSIKGPLSTTLTLLGKWMLISGALQIGRYIVTPLLAIGPALGGLRVAGALMAVTFAGSARAAIAAMAGLTGAARTTAISILQFRATLATTIATMRAGTLTAAGLATAMRTLGASALAASVGGLRALVGLLGGPLLLAFAAAGYAAYSLYNSMADGAKLIEGNTKFLSDNAQTVRDATAAMHYNSTALGNNAGFQNTLSGAVSTGIGFLSSYRAKLDEATNGLYSMAAAAQAATIKTLELARADVTGKLAATKTMSTSALGGLASQQAGKGNYGEAALTQLYRGTQAVRSVLPFGKSQDEINSNIGQLEGRLGKLDAEIAKASDPKAVWNLINHYKATGVGVGMARAPSPEETEKKNGGRKGGRQPSFEEQARKVETAVDTLMAKLMENDPIGKLQNEYIDSITSQAHSLLNDSGYKTFLGAVKADAEAGLTPVQTLINTLSNGANLNKSVVEDLARRYQKSIPQIVEMLGEFQSAHEDAIKEATIKGLDQKFKGIGKAMEAIGDAIPIVAEAKQNIDDLTALGRVAMPAGEGFTKWLTDLRSGAITAQEAMNQLAVVMRDPNLRSKDMSQFFTASDSSPEDVIAAGQRKVAASAETRRQGDLDLKFGERLLQERKNEILLLSMGTKTSEIYKSVQDEVNRLKAKGVDVTRESITALTEEVTAQQKLADQMARNKEFFENNGVRSYLNDLTSTGQAINDLDKNVLQSLEDQLFSLGTTGSFSFKTIFDTIQQGLVRFASQGLMKTLTEKLFAGQTEGGTPSIFGGLFKMFGAKYQPDQMSKLGTEGNPMFVRIDPTTGNLVKGLFDPQVLVGEELGATTTSVLGQSVTDVAGIFKTQLGGVATGFGGVLQQIVGSLAGGAGGGGGGLSGILGSVLSIGMAAFGGPTAAGVARLAPSAAATIAANPGIFKEGGYPGSPVSRMSVHPSAFTNAPHYAEGTANTSGGMPAILHDNEAVIPLSRGRKVAVEMAGGSRGQTINNNFNVSTPDANSFRKSKQQIATDMHMQAGRAFRRNHG